MRKQIILLFVVCILCSVFLLAVFSILPAEILDVILKCYNVSLMLIFLLIIFFIIQAVYKSIKAHKYGQIPNIKPYGLFLMIIWVFLCFQDIMYGEYVLRPKIRKEIFCVLDNTNMKYDIYVEGYESADNEKLFRLLKEMSAKMPNHSHVLDKFKCDIVWEDGSNLLLMLGQDSSNENLFWVFYPQYGYSKSNMVGAIYCNDL